MPKHPHLIRLKKVRGDALSGFACGGQIIVVSYDKMPDHRKRSEGRTSKTPLNKTLKRHKKQKMFMTFMLTFAMLTSQVLKTTVSMGMSQQICNVQILVMSKIILTVNKCQSLHNRT